MLVKFKLDEGAVLPTQSRGDVGFDIYSIEDRVIPTGRVSKVKTGLYIADYNQNLSTVDAQGDYFRQEGYELTVYPKIEGRSSLGIKGIFPIAGIIDPTYRGEICVTLSNMSGEDYAIKKGDKIAQFVFYPCLATPELELSVVGEDQVVMTARGTKGFGSTGR